MADAMLAALAAGTLVVTDAAAGETVTAWDPTKKDATVTDKTSAPQADWSTFLQDHLARDGNGVYQRHADSSHKDRLTGSSACFGMIGDTYYHLLVGTGSQASRIGV
ncbi:hypothetical protein ABID21_000092 [Pseudorhizobium tarimense]|uniref:Uncharacterized protein n=1 Tax=Pseudorhizobium tarimense TaxID=1079109 RepID=A0ABV2H0D2_9HYPH|nr:hypothetical protein [Pseudorhizobium tarimense]MCJ8517344.1 hypothetical protein [Pseudorhizobium tarimense]